MHVLLTEAMFGDADELAEQLRAIGCRVSRCHSRAGICRALASGGVCPLDHLDPVDLMVDVRSPILELTAREFGVVCALRVRMPVAIVPVGDGVPTVPPGLERRTIAVTREQLLRACREAVERHPSRSYFATSEMASGTG
jgi:hypothetical protein